MPELKVKLKGSDLNKTQEEWLVAIEVSEALDRLDLIEAEFRLYNYVSKSSDADKILGMHAEEISVEVIDSSGSVAREIKGEVIEIHSRKDGTNLRTRLRGIDKLHRLKRKQISDEFKGMPNSVVSDVLSEVTGVDSGTVESVSSSSAEFLIANLSAARVIKALGQTYAYSVGAPEGKFYFGRAGSGTGSSKVELDFDTDVIELQIQHSLDGIVTEVEVIGYDAEKDNWITKSAKSSDIKKITTGKLGIDLAKKVGAGKMTIDNAHIQGDTQASAIAKGELQTRARRFCQGTVLAGFLSSATPGAFLEIKNGPKALATKYLITEVTHRKDESGATTELRVISDGLPS